MDPFITVIILHYIVKLTSGHTRIQQWIHGMEMNGYDYTISPSQAAGLNTPTRVEVQMYIESIGEFNSISMDYAVDLYFIETWTDERLNRNLSSCVKFNDEKSILRIWHPDVYFANSKEANYNQVVVPNRSLKICSGGTVRYSVRIAVTLSCYMNLRAYPIDHQKCHIRLLPYASVSTELVLLWKSDEQNSPVQISADPNEADLSIDYTIGIQTVYCNGTYFGEEYSCLRVDFPLYRSISHSLLQLYAPSTTIVAISWISFWIDPTSVPGRTGLAVTTLLTLATHSAGIAFQLPAVCYIKAVDVWISVCMLFLFASLIEFTVVNMYTRSWISGLLALSMSDTSYEASNNSISQFYKKRAIQVDRISRFAFPFLFAIFTLTYWLYYLKL